MSKKSKRVVMTMEVLGDQTKVENGLQPGMNGAQTKVENRVKMSSVFGVQTKVALGVTKKIAFGMAIQGIIVRTVPTKTRMNACIVRTALRRHARNV